jgi:hypothetical protein
LVIERDTEIPHWEIEYLAEEDVRGKHNLLLSAFDWSHLALGCIESYARCVCKRGENVLDDEEVSCFGADEND